MKEKFDHRNLMMCIAIVGAAAILGMAIIIATNNIAESILLSSRFMGKKLDDAVLSLRQVPAPAPMQTPPEFVQPGAKKVEGTSLGLRQIKGNKNAKLAVVEFSDFECPYSKRFYTDAFPQLDKEYITTGKVLFSYRNYPLAFHKDAKRAALVAECAGKQNKYWEMFDKINNNTDLSLDALKKYAKDINLNMQKFEGCLVKEETRPDLEKDITDASRFGVQATPTFFINGRMVEGAYPYEVLKKIIDEELATCPAGTKCK
jgi:protein-disulfide isomerase